MKKILVSIFGVIIVVGLISYCYFVNNKNVSIYSNGDQINIEGITPYDLAYAPVPKLDVNSSEQPLFFNKGNVDLKSSYPDYSGGYYIDMSILGYTLMDNVPTAVVLLSEKSGGTGYFPSIALYQSSDKTSPKIITTSQLKGDRISLKSINISQDKIDLIYRSWSEDNDTKVSLFFENGKLVSK
jgi:hypothetical protein